jgi:hypothetical protein
MYVVDTLYDRYQSRVHFGSPNPQRRIHAAVGPARRLLAPQRAHMVREDARVERGGCGALRRTHHLTRAPLSPLFPPPSSLSSSQAAQWIGARRRGAPGARNVLVEGDKGSDAAAGLPIEEAALAEAVRMNPLLAKANATAARRITGDTAAAYKALQAELDKSVKATFTISLVDLNAVYQKDDTTTQRTVGDILKIVFERKLNESPTGSDEGINLLRTALGAMYKGDGPFFGSKNKLSEHDMLKDFLKGARHKKVETGGGVGKVATLDHEQYNRALSGAVKLALKVRGGCARVWRVCARDAATPLDTSNPLIHPQHINEHKFNLASIALLGAASAVLTMYLCCRAVSVKRIEWRNLTIKVDPTSVVGYIACRCFRSRRATSARTPFR